MTARAFHPQSLMEDREGAISMLGGKPTVLDALIAHKLLRPVRAANKLVLFDVGDIISAYGKAKQAPDKYFHRPSRKTRRTGQAAAA